MKSWQVNALAILIGGAVGSLLRYGVNTWSVFTAFPLGTLLENISASFILGGLTGWILYVTLPEWFRLGAGVGFCGSFSTMSMLAADATVLIQHGTFYGPILYLFLSLFGGVGSGLLGLLIGEKMGKRERKIHQHGR